MVEVIKNENESSVNLIRRFKNKIRQASIVNKAKAKQFKKRSISKNLKKKTAVKRALKLKKPEYGVKSGRI